MHQKQNYTLFKIKKSEKKVKSQSTTPLNNDHFVSLAGVLGMHDMYQPPL